MHSVTAATALILRRIAHKSALASQLPGYGPEGTMHTAKTALCRKLIRPFTAIVCILMLTGLAAAQDTAAIRTEIISMPLGTSMEVRLKDKQRLRGARGAVSDSGFTFVDARSGERQIAFGDVASVKQVRQQSHTIRNALIATGVVMGVIALIFGIAAATGHVFQG